MSETSKLNPNNTKLQTKNREVITTHQIAFRLTYYDSIEFEPRDPHDDF